MASWNNLNFQDANSPIMEQLIFLHDHTMMIIIMIMIFISYIIVILTINSFTNRFFINNQFMEIIWTILPAFMLLFIAFPSLKTLYMLDEIMFPNLSFKAIGHQWYWSYEFPEFNLDFNSYMKQTNEIEINEFRLLETDHRIIIPINTEIRMLTTSMDVIHSWAMPSLGIKIDAIPGRLNQVFMYINRPGIFFGQCSEICGMNHSFMPIVIESIPPKNFINWINFNIN
uniref:Cytochrome c oxidase subunit 2 n=1 Tax=Megalodontes quinquecinctus TaxID=2491145 RepID=A0A3Q8U9W3_9HYME|nr:cytochrome c oxidase subunit 2 [Megalodontes quinquecinctus]